MPQRYHIVLNGKAGSVMGMGMTGEDLLQRFAAEGLEASIDADDENPLAQRLAAAIASDAEIIVAAGGDGTVTALAAAVAGTSKVLAVLPLGTANLLARDLGIPLAPDQAIKALASMSPRRIDVAEVNGQLFLHNVTIGFGPKVAVRREEMRGRNAVASTIEFCGHLLRHLQQARRIAVEIAPSNGQAHIERVHAVTIANNRYEEGLGRFFARDRLDRGELTLYIVKGLSVSSMLRLITGMALGRWHNDSALTVESVREATIRLKRPTVLATVDGEVERLAVPLKFAIRPAALAVLAPPDETKVEAASPDLVAEP
jgi:diacylglycerol kinase family enzyme